MLFRCRFALMTRPLLNVLMDIGLLDWRLLMILRLRDLRRVRILFGGHVRR